MCWTLQPQSFCNHCSAEVNFTELEDPCQDVLDQGAAFGACGDIWWRIVNGPKDCVCDDCLSAQENRNNRRVVAPGHEVHHRSRFNSQVYTQSAVPRFAPEGHTKYQSSVPARTSTVGVETPFVRTSTQDYIGAGSGVISADRNKLGPPFQPLNSQFNNHRREDRVSFAAVPLARDVLRHRRGTQGYRRAKTPMPRNTLANDAEEEDEESSNGGAHLSGHTSSATSGYTSSTSSTLPHPVLNRSYLGASPFAFGRTPDRPVPNPSPITNPFLRNYFTTHQSHPITHALQDETWIPAEWGPAIEMPPSLVHELSRTTPTSTFHRHRVYFCPMPEDPRGDTVMVVTPSGLKVRVLSSELYMTTIAVVNRIELAVQAQEYKRQLAHERENQRRRERGACIFHPCRVAGCPRFHDEGQHRPLVPANASAFLRANRRLRGGEGHGSERMRRRSTPGSWVNGEIRSSRDVPESEEREDGDDAVAPVSRQATAVSVEDEPETPSTLHLSAEHDAKRAPRKMFEKDGTVRYKSFKDLTVVSTGSPVSRRSLQKSYACLGSDSPRLENASDGADEVGQKEAYSSSAAKKMFDDGPDLGDLRIWDEDETY
ncbi:uncharacterized protein CTRU02_211175 [Colletotrichum truncatum]|uniref:Uncharacterized protein n=1 Tax=Colletotrichum truncatum TaxID=5467 RepID=A0ACC3YR85_COLTU|nr:uncharacterized protein CTRU02_01956 [Colletotrichum truncatum]KAF6799085.1 hypothetical protein CTRU02_01956 [Colletotrichum truncatum]